MIILKVVFSILAIFSAFVSLVKFVSVDASNAPASELGYAVFWAIIALAFGVASRHMKGSGDDSDLGGRKLSNSEKGNGLTEAQIRERASARLEQLQLKSKGKPLLALHAGGSGIAIAVGSAFFLSCRDNAFAISYVLSNEEVVLPYGNLIAFEVTGPGTEITNAGLAGGGFGIEGALQGIAAAALVNAATTKKTTNTFLRVATAEGEAYFHFNGIEPQALRLAFSSAALAAEANKSRNIHNTPSNLASELQKLHQLKIDGILNEEEFAVAKRKLID